MFIFIDIIALLEANYKNREFLRKKEILFLNILFKIIKVFMFSVCVVEVRDLFE